MVGHAKWISLTAVSLVLLWQHLPAHAQFPVDDDAAPGQLAPPSDDQYPGLEEEDALLVIEGEDADDADMEEPGPDDDTYEIEGEVETYPADEPQEAQPLPKHNGAQEQGETIKERFPDGKVRIEREVTQDSAGNYLNHGSWKMWNQSGQIVAQGQYRYGNRTGTWIRWYRSVSEAPILRAAPYKDFPGPYVSQGTFENDKLNGFWTIYDGKLRKISQWRFVDGRRHGLSIWWHSNGNKMREIEFRDGDIDGHLIEWAPAGSVLTRETYQAGRKLAQKTTFHKDRKQKKSEGMYLFAKDAEKTPDDWWNCKLVETTKTGADERHGPWSSWHPNGQRQLEGTYDHDLQVGLFTWWHANGQKNLEGRFIKGKQDGPWVWWYDNGQKSIQGEYAKGNPTGRWTWWDEDGRVAQSADLSGTEGVVIQTLPEISPSMLPQARKPAVPAPKPMRR
jgi:antitoxin component YwqK of YwqJK toxin-antitoxin module